MGGLALALASAHSALLEEVLRLAKCYFYFSLPGAEELEEMRAGEVLAGGDDFERRGIASGSFSVPFTRFSSQATVLFGRDILLLS